MRVESLLISHYELRNTQYELLNTKVIKTLVHIHFKRVSI